MLLDIELEYITSIQLSHLIIYRQCFNQKQFYIENDLYFRLRNLSSILGPWYDPKNEADYEKLRCWVSQGKKEVSSLLLITNTKSKPLAGDTTCGVKCISHVARALSANEIHWFLKQLYRCEQSLLRYLGESFIFPVPTYFFLLPSYLDDWI
jgi:hypothetical protein